MNRVLLIEDDTNVRNSLIEFLKIEGIAVLEASNLAEAEVQLKEQPDLILLDWMLPDGPGIEFLKNQQRLGLLIPIIVLTARTSVIDKVLGLELGASDYITKPFEPRELVARIRVQLRHRQTASSDAKRQVSGIESSGIKLDLLNYKAFYQKKPLSLTKTEYELLRFFVENPNRVFSREELLKQVWGYHQYPTTRTVDTHLLQLRQKIKQEFFETVHGIGYRFKPAAIS